MRIGQARLIVAFAFGLLAWSLSADAATATKIARVGILSDEKPVAWRRRPSSRLRKGCGISVGSKGRTSPSSGVTRQEKMRSFRALPPSWSSFSRTSSSPSAHRRHGRPRAQPRRSRSSSPGPPIRSALAWFLSLARPGGNLTGVSEPIARNRRQTAGIADHGRPGHQTRRGPLGSDFPPDGPQLTEIEAGGPFLEPGARADGRARPRRA